MNSRPKSLQTRESTMESFGNTAKIIFKRNTPTLTHPDHVLSLVILLYKVTRDATNQLLAIDL